MDQKNVVLIGQDFLGLKFESKDFTTFLVPEADDPRCVQPNPDGFISAPHSNSFLDLNGDCMPEIFMQKTVKSGSGYKHYIEIYIQKHLNG